jgi:ABC-type transporter Mla MlaB component
MTVRIFRTTTTLRIDGRLDSSNVEAVEEACEGLKPPAELDLTHLVSADEKGLSVILDLLGRGAELVGANPYFELLVRIKLGERVKVAKES